LRAFWQRLSDSFTSFQKTILKICAVVGTFCLIILGIDQFIVQPRQSAESASLDARSIGINVKPPALDLGLDKNLKRTRAELDALRLERERQFQLRRDQNERNDSEPDEPVPDDAL